MDTVRVILVDDHVEYRKVIKLILNQHPNIEIVGEASTGMEFLEIVKRHHSDVVFLDYNLPDMKGDEATIKALDDDCSLRIITMNIFGDLKYVDKMLRSGAKGFILKFYNTKEEELLDAIELVMKGEFYFSRHLADQPLLRDN